MSQDKESITGSDLSCHWLGWVSFCLPFPFFCLIHWVLSQPLTASLGMFPKQSVLCVTIKGSRWTLPCYLLLLCVWEQIQRDFEFSSFFFSEFFFPLYYLKTAIKTPTRTLHVLYWKQTPSYSAFPIIELLKLDVILVSMQNSLLIAISAHPRPDNQPECQLSKVPEIESDKAIISFSLSVLYHFLPLNCS